jgi:YVTN family beta-propeller protein
MRRASLAAGLCGLLVLGAWASGQGADGPAARFRRPVALLLADGGKRLFVANQRSGTLSVIDIAGRRVTAEVPVGRRLSDLTATPDGRTLLATDEEAHELIVLSRRDAASDPDVSRRIPVHAFPVSVQVAADGSRCCVASLWSRQVTVIDLARPDVPNRTIDLPFAPRKQLLVDGGRKLLVADAFAGRLAVIDIARGTLEAAHDLPAHNIRGLALSRDGERLYLTHQTLDSRTPTTRDDVHWGNLMTNNLRALPLAAVLAPREDVLRGSRLYHLGDVGKGAGDPAGLCVGTDGQVVLALAGVGEVAVGPESSPDRHRLAVGRRPTAVAVSPDGRRAYVANTFADSVSVVDLQNHEVEAEVSLGPQPEPRAEDRGEVLFHDARLSHDGWLSCQSCHTDGHTTGRRNDNLGDGSFGAPKRILSLLGVRDTAPWAWNGSMTDLESQVRKSVLTTMHGRPPSPDQVADLAAFLRTLPPPPPLARLRGRVDEAAAGRGREVFRTQGCAACHAPPGYTSAKIYDVGLSDEVGNKEFNPPSLRGVSQGGPYFHDGRAATLEEVFTRHRHQLKADLAKEELEDLLEFLRTL